jgi:hypothetical protein
MAIPYLERALETVATQPGGILFEGERVHPELVAELTQRNLGSGAFVVETDAEGLHDTLLRRSSRFAAEAEDTRRKVVEVNRLYNLWLTDECQRLGLSVVASQPWDTLERRIGAALALVHRKTRGKPATDPRAAATGGGPRLVPPTKQSTTGHH